MGELVFLVPWERVLGRSLLYYFTSKTKQLLTFVKTVLTSTIL